MINRPSPKYVLAGVTSLLLLLTSGCGFVARQSLKSDSGKKSFMDSCVSEASKSGALSAEKVNNYCQCSLDELSSDRVSDADLDEFIKSQSSSGEMPEAITQILTECAQKTLS